MGRKIRKKRTGGLLIGPSHEDGGILATTPGMPDVELEGGEYIINAQTVNALGTEFLDKLNSTQTTYHTGGFGAGQLPNPSNYRRGGVIRKKRRGGNIRRMPHGGPHNQDNMVTVAGQFINRRTGQPVPAGTFYHIHPDKGPMEGAVHNPDIPGGQVGHDFYDPANGGSPIMNTGNGGGGYRRGGRIKRMPHGGPHNGSGRNGCPPGMTMRNGQCVSMSSTRSGTRTMSSGYRRGGGIRRMPHGGPHNGNGRMRTSGRRFGSARRPGGNGIITSYQYGVPPHDPYPPLPRVPRTRMPHGGPHNGNGTSSVFCPNGNYGYDEFGNTKCV